MNVLKTLILVCMMAVFGACGLLQEKNEGALASTYATLYAFFETQAVGSVGCYPNTADNNNYSPDNTLKAEYSFQVEVPSTMVACVKDTTVYNVNNNQVAMESILASHTISFYVTDTAVNPGTFVAGLIRVPVLGAIQNTYVLGSSSTACPFNTADLTTHLVGKFNMNTLTDYQYITAVDDSCGASVGSGLSPFYLAQQYGVTY
jgi:hypothetical protein